MFFCDNRYRTMARAVRLGYNVLSTDNDVIMFDDFYSYFKSPPFDSFTVINMQEVPGKHNASKWAAHCTMTDILCVLTDPRDMFIK